MIELPFVNRTQAGRHLADHLRAFADSRPLVLAVPCGGVPVGRAVADRLNADLDVVLVRQLHVPLDSDQEMGAVDDHGWIHLDARLATMDIEPDYYVQSEIERARRRLAEQVRRYRGQREAIDCTGRVVIVVDDGLGAGSAMAAALRAVRARNPDYLVCAVPVGSDLGLDVVEPLADETLCLATPLHFAGVARFYLDFKAVGDDEVAALLKPRPLTRTA